jgi:uncharacterized protein
VHSLYSVNKALQEGRIFFSSIYHRGILVYDASDTPLSPPTIHKNIDYLENFQAHWNRHFGLAKKFLNGASYYIKTDSPTVAAFLLHQATEFTCIALIKACLDYRPATHNLSRLLVLTENFSPDPSCAFPQTTDDELDLFRTLLHAYSDARYNENYKVPIEKAKKLRQRVKDLQDISEKLYNYRLSMIRHNTLITLN